MTSHKPDQWIQDGLANGAQRWTIQIRYTDRDDDGKTRNVQSAYQTEARSLPDAYENARLAFEGRNVRFGAIIPGHHVLVP